MPIFVLFFSNKFIPLPLSLLPPFSLFYWFPDMAPCLLLGLLFRVLRGGFGCAGFVAFFCSLSSGCKLPVSPIICSQHFFHPKALPLVLFFSPLYRLFVVPPWWKLPSSSALRLSRNYYCFTMPFHFICTSTSTDHDATSVLVFCIARSISPKASHFTPLTVDNTDESLAYRNAYLCSTLFWIYSKTTSSPFLLFSLSLRLSSSSFPPLPSLFFFLLSTHIKP